MTNTTDKPAPLQRGHYITLTTVAMEKHVSPPSVVSSTRDKVTSESGRLELVYRDIGLQSGHKSTLLKV